MDIHITDAENLPERAFLSIRAGEVRRQLQYKPGQVFHFDPARPSGPGGAGARSFVVDVFEKISSAQVRLSDLEPAMDGADSELDCPLSMPCFEGAAPVRLGMRVHVKDASGGADHPVKRSPSSRVSRHQAALDAKSYLDSNAVQKLLQDMVHELLAERPVDAIGFMLAYLRRFYEQQREAPQQQDAKQEQSLERQEEQVACPPTRPGLLAEEEEEEEVPGFPIDGSGPLPDLAEHRSLCAKLLRKDPSLYRRLQRVRTPLGVSLAQCIKTGIDNKGHAMIKSIGLVAGDEACYAAYQDVFDPVIAQLHGQLSNSGSHPTDLDASKVDSIEIDPEGHRVVSVQVCGGRNLRGFRLPPAISRKERREVERIVSAALLGLQGDLAGEYLSLGSAAVPGGGASAARLSQLQEERLCFREPDSSNMLCAGYGRHWPESRGVFVTADESLAVWVNECDHIKILSRQAGADLRRAFERFARVERLLLCALQGESMQYAHTEQLGFVSTCPSNLGTGLHVTASLRIPLLSGREQEFMSLCKQSDLGACIRCTAAAGLPEADISWDISCREKLGSSEVCQVNKVISGCRRMLALERKLEEGLPLDEHDLSGDARGPAGSLGTAERRGFSADECPLEMPDLSGHCSLAASQLQADPSLFPALRERRTAAGTSLAPCIKTCFDNKGHPMLKSVGLVAGDELCYETFRELFDPIALLRHPTWDQSKVQRAELDAGEVSSQPLDPSGGDRVISVCIRTSRNLGKIRMPPVCSPVERRQVESLVVEALGRLPDDLRGSYYPLLGSASREDAPGGMSSEDAGRLGTDGLLFEEPDSQVLISSGYSRDWPDARGVFVDSTQRIVIWVNEVDHVRVAAMQEGGGLKEAFDLLCRVHCCLEEFLRPQGHGFSFSDRFGFLGSCPSRLGTCLDACVTLRIPLLSAYPQFRVLCRELKLQAHLGIASHAAAREGLWNVQNAERLGSTEVEQVNVVIVGCRTLLELERCLEQGQDVGASFDVAFAASRQR